MNVQQIPFLCNVIYVYSRHFMCLKFSSNYNFVEFYLPSSFSTKRMWIVLFTFSAAIIAFAPFCTGSFNQLKRPISNFGSKTKASFTITFFKRTNLQGRLPVCCSLLQPKNQIICVNTLNWLKIDFP